MVVDISNKGKPLMRSASAVRHNGSADLTVKSQEHFADLDLALLKIEWLNGVPSDQLFPQKIALTNTPIAPKTKVVSAGFPRELYLPLKSFTIRPGLFLMFDDKFANFEEMSVSFGDSGSPILAELNGIPTLISLVHQADASKKLVSGTKLQRLYDASPTFRSLFDKEGNAISHILNVP